MTCFTDIVWCVPHRNMVDNSVKYTVAGRSNFPPPLAAVYVNQKSEGVPYIRMAGTTHRFGPGRPDKMLLNIELYDVDMDLDVCGSVKTKNRAYKLLTKGGVMSY